jgi:hypothetical protein
MRKILLTAIPSVFVATAAFGGQTNVTLGIHFGMGDHPAAIPLAATDVAGVPEVAQANWNDTGGANGTALALVEDDNGAAVITTAQAVWSSPNTWSSTGRTENNNNFPFLADGVTPGPDRVLMTGYLDTGAPSTTTVTISGIPPEFATVGYDVYVYFLGGVGPAIDARGGGYRIMGQTTWKLGDAIDTPSTYVEDPGLSHSDRGDYLTFRGFLGDTIVIQASTDFGLGAGATPRAPLNAVQLVVAPIRNPIVRAPSQICATGFMLLIDDVPLFGGVVDPTTVALQLDGSPVSSTATKPPAGTETTVVYTTAPPNLLAAGTHTLGVSFVQTNGAAGNKMLNFTVDPYLTVPASLAAGTHVNPLTDATGFKARIHQLPVQRTGGRYASASGPWDPNTNRDMEEELADGYLDPATGLPYDNVANLTAVPPDELPDVFYQDVINWNTGSPASANVGHFVPDNMIPGEPGGGTPAATDSDAADIETFLQLKAGCYRFGVNSDDGFRFTFGIGRGDLYGAVAGKFDTGRGAADTIFDVYIPADGFYPIRCDWENGTGGANIEIFTVNIADGSLHLVNDATDLSGEAIPAFRGGYAQAYIKSILPVNGDPAAPLEQQTVVVHLLDDAPSTVTQASISMTLDGKNYPNGDANLHIDASGLPLTVVTLNPPAPGFLPGSSHSGSISFNGTSNNFSFTMDLLLPGIFVIEAEDFDSTDPSTGITTHNPGLGISGSDTDYNPLLMPYLGGAFQGLGGIPGMDYLNNDRTNNKTGPGIGLVDTRGYTADAYRAGESPDVSMDPRFPRTVDGNTVGDLNRGAYEATTSYKIGWADSADWYDYTRDFGPTPQFWNVIVALSSGAGPPNVDSTLYEVTSGVGTLSQNLNKLGTFSGTAPGGWGNNGLFPLKDGSGNNVVLRLSGQHTIRFNPDNGDYDWFAFVPLTVTGKKAQFGVSTPANGDTVARNTPINIPIYDYDTTVVDASVHLMVDGADKTGSATITHDVVAGVTTIHYVPGFAVNTSNSYSASFTDSGGASSVLPTVSYMTDPIRGPGDFVIEIEDFNFNGGQHQPISDVMPYYGGAYQDDASAGLITEILNIDYHNDDGLDSNLYRFQETGKNVNLNLNMGGPKNHRSGWDVTVNYKMGWVGGDWNTYTRVFPKGDYKVYAALSFDGTGADQCHGRLQLVSDPTTATPVLTDLGTFSAHGTHNLGGWGGNTLIPMRNAAGCVAVIHLDGATSLRYNADSGDSDYLTFVPAVQLTGPAGTITGIKYNGDGTVTITWTGAGELDVADNITGPWTTVPGATSPLTVPVDRPHRFARLVVCLDEPESWPKVP